MNKEGKITQGTYKEICDSEILSEISSFTSAVKANQRSFTNTLAQWTAESDEASNSNGVETELEDRMIGSVSYLTYWKYFTYGMSNIVMVTMVILLLLPEGKQPLKTSPYSSNPTNVISNSQGVLCTFLGGGVPLDCWTAGPLIL